MPGFLLVLGGFWRLAKTMQKIDAETLPKSPKKGLEGSKIMKNEPQIHSKIRKMAPKSDSGRIFDAGWQRIARGTMFWSHFGATWPILAAILASAGSHNEPFWHQISKKEEK